MEFRPATPQDCSDIARIQVDSCLTAYAPILPTAYLEHFTYTEQEQDWRDWFASNAEGVLFVAVDEQGELIGYALGKRNPDKTAYLAYADGQLAGQIILRKNWNGYACIEDIAVDVNFRRQGIGRRLIEQAVAWAKARELPGIMLETQNNNVAACRLYETCGFHLGGFDQQLYRALDPDSEEIALYWYLRCASLRPN